jgi:hypothetical protein
MSNKIEIVVNGVEFQEVNAAEYIIHAAENPYPFLNCIKGSWDNSWTYKSLRLDGKFYAPKYFYEKEE